MNTGQSEAGQIFFLLFVYICIAVGNTVIMEVGLGLSH